MKKTRTRVASLLAQNSASLPRRPSEESSSLGCVLLPTARRLSAFSLTSPHSSALTPPSSVHIAPRALSSPPIRSINMPRKLIGLAAIAAAAYAMSRPAARAEQQQQLSSGSASSSSSTTQPLMQGCPVAQRPGSNTKFDSSALPAGHPSMPAGHPAMPSLTPITPKSTPAAHNPLAQPGGCPMAQHRSSSSSSSSSSTSSVPSAATSSSPSPSRPRQLHTSHPALLPPTQPTPSTSKPAFTHSAN